MITFEEGLIMTCRLPLFSALYMLLSASFKTLTLTILPKTKLLKQEMAAASVLFEESRKAKRALEGMVRLNWVVRHAWV